MLERDELESLPVAGGMLRVGVPEYRLPGAIVGQVLVYPVTHHYSHDLPSYRGVMDRDGSGGPGGASVLGTEAEVLASIEQYAEAGCTDFAPVEFTLTDEEAAATRAVLKSLL